METYGQDPTRHRQSHDQLTGTDLFPETDRYQMLEKPLQGGMGLVFKALDQRLDRTVAIKRIRPEFAQDNQLISRFQREATTMAKFRHPHLVQIYELDSDAIGPFIIMDWIEGSNLASVLKEQGALQTDLAIQIIIQVAEALQVAHDAGVIHRDIKPANILLDKKNQAYISDFGLVRIEAETISGKSETVTGALLGTVDFIAPEQLHDPRNANELSDLWSLGATFYQILTGFSVRARDDDLLPEALRPYVLKALKPRPEDRFTSMKELANALRKVVHVDSENEEQYGTIRPELKINEADLAPRETSEHDLADLLIMRRNQISQIQDQVNILINEKHDYSTALHTYSKLPEHLRDSELYADISAKNERIIELDKVIKDSVENFTLAGLRENIEELLALQPQRADLQRLISELGEVASVKGEIASVKNVVVARVPSVGESISEVQVGDILVKKGDTVYIEQAIVEVETEKATFDVPSPSSGSVIEIHVKTGQMVEIGAPIVSIKTF